MDRTKIGRTEKKPDRENPDGRLVDQPMGRTNEGKVMEQKIQSLQDWERVSLGNKSLGLAQMTQ